MDKKERWWRYSSVYEMALPSKKILYEEGIRRSKLIEKIDNFTVVVSDIQDNKLIFNNIFRENGITYQATSVVLLGKLHKKDYVEKIACEVVLYINEQIEEDLNG